jgi:P4 family phage/plasmid primase-like protien
MSIIAQNTLLARDVQSPTVASPVRGVFSSLFNPSLALVTEKCEQLDKFLEAIGYAEDEPLHIRAFRPNKHKSDPHTFITTRKKITGNARAQLELIGLNKTHGIYFVVNAGGKSDAEITRFNAFFVERDDVAIAEQHSLLDAAPIQPSIRVETKKSVHAYYLLDGDCDAAEWRDIQLRLISHFNGDKSIKNPSRIMRLPFFNHLSITETSGDIKSKPVELHTIKPYRRFTVQQMRDAFPDVESRQRQSSLDDVVYGEFAVTLNDPVKDRANAKEALLRLSPERCNEYQSWIEVGIALYNIFDGDDEGFGLWRAWSKQSSKYYEGECEAKWDTFGGREDAAKLTVASLILWARKDNPEQESTNEADVKDALTDLGNAHYLVRLHGQNLRYNKLVQKWFVWDETRWIEDTHGEVIERAKVTAATMLQDAIDENKKTLGMKKEQVKHALSSQSERRLRSMVSLAQSDPAIRINIDAFDSDPYMLNVSNGTLDLRTGELHQHRRDELITKLVPVSYSPEANAPLWTAFLNRIFNGNQNLIHFIQRATGYTLTGSINEQCLFIMHGTGANGKSTFINTIAELLSDYGQNTPTETLMIQKNRSGATEDIARLRGARFVSAVETDAGQRLSESLVKQLTGGDRVTARFLYSHLFEYSPQFKIWLAANYKPNITGTDHAIWRRIKLIPFDVTIPENERDPNLPSKLRDELSGILAWAVKGAMEWYASGLGEPDEVKRATAAFAPNKIRLRSSLLIAAY